MAFADLRAFLGFLKSQEEELLEISEAVDPDYEAAAVLGFRRHNAPAIILENLDRYPDWKMAANVLGTRRRVALALGVPEEEANAEYFRRKSQAIPPREVSTGPAKEVVIVAPVEVRDYLPVPIFHQDDAGPYITAGVCIAQDRTTGRYHLGIHRVQVKGGNRLGIFLANPPLANWLEEAEDRGERLEIAIAIGVDPALLLAAVARIPTRPGLPDKMAVAGGLRGEPIEVTPCETIGVKVPAAAEVIIEGKIIPKVREKEGPFGETSGYYFAFDNPVLEVTAICHRRSPIYQAIVPGAGEAETVVGLCSASEIEHHLSEMVSGFRGFAFLPGTCCFQGVVALRKKTSAEARRAALLAMALDSRLKQVVVVDEDVDIHSPEDVTWAVATRCRPDQDILILSGLPGYPIDPAVEGTSTAKVIIDATKPENRAADFKRAMPLPSAQAKAARIWQRYLEGGRQT
ncbi:MAG: UbiD family decarboxylase [Moorellales bacterium]